MGGRGGGGQCKCSSAGTVKGSVALVFYCTVMLYTINFKKIVVPSAQICFNEPLEESMFILSRSVDVNGQMHIDCVALTCCSGTVGRRTTLTGMKLSELAIREFV